MTQDVGILSTRAAELAEELRVFLGSRFQIAMRVRKAAHGIGLRLYQVRKPKNRHLVDLRPVDQLPPSRRVGNVAVVTPPELIALRVMAVILATIMNGPAQATKRGDRRKEVVAIDCANGYHLIRHHWNGG